MVMIQAQVVELPVTGTHLPSAASVALDVGDLAHCLSYCPTFSDLRVQWCVDTGVAPSDAPWWASGEWVFRPLARGQHSVGHAGSRPIRGARLLPSGRFAPILLNMLFQLDRLRHWQHGLPGGIVSDWPQRGRLPWWRLLTCEALSTWAILSRLPFLFFCVHLV